MEFWVDWELWEKMCSILGCLIAIVLVYGFIVLFYNRRMLKKYAALEAQEKVEGRILGKEDEEIDNIPFGARAIERGIQVDGIWISGQNTPSRSPIPSGTPVVSRRASSTTNASSQDTLKPPPITVTACDGISSPFVDTPRPYMEDMETQGFQPYLKPNGVPSETFEVDRLSADEETLQRNETLEIDRSGHDYAAYQEYLQPSRSNSPVDRPTTPFVPLNAKKRTSSISLDSLAGFEGNFKFQRYSDSSERLIQSPSRPVPEQRISPRISPRSSHESLKLNPVEDPPLDESGLGDLASLRTHRLSHVAETGQLGSARNSPVVSGGYGQSIHPQELAAKLAQVIEEEGD